MPRLSGALKGKQVVEIAGVGARICESSAVKRFSQKGKLGGPVCSILILSARLIGLYSTDSKDS